MKKGKPGEYFEAGGVAGYYNSQGKPVVMWESGTDRDQGKYSEEIQNGVGYYDDSGKFQYYDID